MNTNSKIANTRLGATVLGIRKLTSFWRWIGPIAGAVVITCVAHSGFAQGQISIYTGSYAPVRTNSIGLGGSAGNTSPAANGFYYALFTADPSVTSLSPLDLLSATWRFTGTYATNTGNPDGGRLLGGFCTRVAGWHDTTNSYVFAGWSANIAGPDWNAVATQLTGASFNNGVWSGPNWLLPSDRGFFGVSMVGRGVALNPVHGQPCFNLFGMVPYGYIDTPISTGWDLFVTVPEPSTGIVAAIAMGSFWLVRRRI